MDIPPLLIYILQGTLLVAGTYLVWAGWQIRSHGRIDLMKGHFGRAMTSPKLVAQEYGLFNLVFGAALIAVVLFWAGLNLSIATATIATMIVSVAGTGWRGMLMRLHDMREHNQNLKG